MPTTRKPDEFTLDKDGNTVMDALSRAALKLSDPAVRKLLTGLGAGRKIVAAVNQIKGAFRLVGYDPVTDTQAAAPDGKKR